MKIYNEKGELVIDAQLDAADKREGRDVLYTASDQEADALGLLRLILIEQRQIKLHLASMSDENVGGRDAQ